MRVASEQAEVRQLAWEQGQKELYDQQKHHLEKRVAVWREQQALIREKVRARSAYS